nr:ribonuclease H-like domain-containing protein [Tanacetum cinerariifolium]
MDDPNITMREYIMLKEEKARRRAIVFNYTLTSETTLSYEPTVSSLNDEIDFRVSFDDSDDEDYTRMRVEQYIQIIDYALWDVIENGSTLPKTQVVKGVTTLMPITSLEHKTQRTLEVKGISTLMMAIPNEHQSKFNSIKDAKQLMKAIKKIFGGNAAIKKT